MEPTEPMHRTLAPWEPGWVPCVAPPPAPHRPKPPPAPMGNPAWLPGCESPNPKGRPPGLPDKRLLATEQMLNEMRAIVSVLAGKALEGDTNAASIVLSKVMPSLKAQAQPVRFTLNTSAPISAQVASVLDGIADGSVAPDVGRLIIESIKALAEVRASEELEARIAALEAVRGA